MRHAILLPVIPFLLHFLAANPAGAQNKDQVRPPDDSKVEQAVRKGAAWLKKNASKFKGDDSRDCELELVLLTLVHAGVPDNDPVLAKLMRKMLDQKPLFTYRTGLRAMVLEEVQRVRYQPQLYHCAQFLVNNQSSNGIWGYGKPVEFDDIGPAPGVATGGKTRPGGVKVYGSGSSGPRVKPKVVRRIRVKRGKRVGSGGDNSNSQYAALGLRACHDAGLVIPPETVDLAIRWWRQCQKGAKDSKQRVATTGAPAGVPRGWGYRNDDKLKGSMTAGAVGALSIFLYMQGKQWRRDQDLADGVAWLAENFSVTENPKAGGQWHFYYLYGLERAGMLYETTKFGTHDWYAEGAKYLLENQGKDGGWKGNKSNRRDTCFAILFLKRATRPLVETVGGGRRR